MKRAFDEGKFCWNFSGRKRAAAAVKKVKKQCKTPFTSSCRCRSFPAAFVSLKSLPANDKSPCLALFLPLLTMPSLRKFLFILLLFPVFHLAGQVGGAWREKPVFFAGDTLTLDTLSIVPGTFSLFQNEQKLDSTQYVLLPADAKLVLNKNVPRENLRVKYAVYPFLLTQEHAHKNQKTFTSSPDHAVNPFLYRPGELKTEDPFATGGLNKSGSLSRGISFGNNRDVSVNSSLNLQLSGKLTEGVELMMVATDDNLPLQADGTTQQLQEFDRVFIQLSSKSTKLIAGDFFASRPNSYFMNFNKRGQGLNVTSVIPMDSAKAKLSVTGSAAISKGKFARSLIQGTEGNQGPYRLRGAENELFIVVLSGTEKVYIDGKLLVRGQENDYTINYNTAELTFTAKQLITKDKRIVVEFQYSDRNYSRSMFHTGFEYSTEKYALRFNAFSEQDSKNQPLQQTLTNEDKLKMAAVGDTLLKAFVSGVDSVPFSGDLVLYLKKDTLVNSVLYTDVYVYNTSPDSAHYRLSFTYLGPHNGNYIQISSAANGKTFQWVAPIAGIPQGEYEPVILLITPKKKQLVTFGGDFKFIKNTLINTELAYSNNDLNTFSPYNAFDDHGYGAHLNIKNKQKIRDSLSLLLEGNYEYVSSYFSPLERYRPVEFERDWNLITATNTGALHPDQHLGKAGIALVKNGFGTVGYDFSTFLNGTTYTGLKHSVNSTIRKKGFTLIARGSLLNSTGTYGATDFIRHRVDVSQKIFKQLTISAYEDQEINSIYRPSTDSLQLSSLSYFEWQGAVTIADTTKRSFTVFYKQRTDRLPSGKAFINSAVADNIGGTIILNGNVNHQLRVTASYRNLNIISPLLISQAPDHTVVGRLEYTTRLWKSVLTGQTFYEVGSGLEVKKEYSYLEVPTGQGTYAWSDYNGDGVKQLNEFEVAVYSDQANYIRVFTPTNDYVKVYTNQFSQSINLRPAAIWATSKGVKGAIARFSDQAVYRVERKTQSNDPYYAFLPTLNDVSDTALVSLNATVRNTVSFNQLSSKFGLEYTWQEVSGKSLLTNGRDSRSNTFNEGKVRWNITKSLSLQTIYRDGYKRSASEYFAAKNYRIHYYETEPKFSIQPGTTFRVSFSYRYAQKQNTPDLGGESANIQKFGTELKLSRLSKGSFLAEANYIRIKYNGVESSAIGYDMLEGLRAGQNFTWKVSWQRSLATNLQLTLGYEGRKTPGANFIHTGSAQVRAIF
jgi:hypothetical protein